MPEKRTVYERMTDEGVTLDSRIHTLEQQVTRVGRALSKAHDEIRLLSRFAEALDRLVVAYRLSSPKQGASAADTADRLRPRVTAVREKYGLTKET